MTDSEVSRNTEWPLQYWDLQISIFGLSSGKLGSSPELAMISNARVMNACHLAWRELHVQRSRMDRDSIITTEQQ